MMPKPVASATPDGNTRISRPYRWIPEHKLKKINETEEAHRLHGFGNNPNWNQPIASRSNIVGSHRSVIVKFGKINMKETEHSSYGVYRRSAESRSHSRRKARARRNWQRNKY